MKQVSDLNLSIFLYP